MSLYLFVFRNAYWIGHWRVSDIRKQSRMLIFGIQIKKKRKPDNLYQTFLKWCEFYDWDILSMELYINSW